jgi:hypothetical protein
MTMRAVNVLAKRDLLNTLVTRDVVFRRTAIVTAESRIHAGFMPTLRLLQDPDALYERLIQHPTLSALSMGETYCVAPDMAHLTNMAAEDMPPEPLLEGDIPSTHGFMWVEGGVPIIDVRGSVNKIHAFTWTTISGVVVLMTWTYKYDMTDEVNARLAKDFPKDYREVPELSWSGDLITLHYGATPKPSIAYTGLGDRQIEFKDDAAGRAVLTYSDTGEVVPEENAQTKVSSAQWFITACRLMQQTLATRTLETVRPKALRRFDLKDDTITVVRLRRPKYVEGEGHGDVEWNFQWIVRGHWRNQPYKDESGEVVYRRIYIAPFVKGPEGKPLKRSRILNVWDR